jgi:hypothetical protein
MRYLWIFVGCYVLAFAIINFRMALQRANMDARFKEIGGSPEKLQANIRAVMPLPQEIFIRLWAPVLAIAYAPNHSFKADGFAAA